MDTVSDRYDRIIKEILDRHAREPEPDGVRAEVVCDESNGHYELMRSGWDGIHRIHGSLIHIDIRDGKVWIEYDGTYDGVAEELVAAGIPRERIVLGFKHP